MNENKIANDLTWLTELFEQLNDKILQLDSAQREKTNNYIGYWLKLLDKRPRLFAEVHIQKVKKQIVVHLRSLEYNDPNNKIFIYKYVPKWPLSSGIIIANREDLNYALPFIKESYKAILELTI